MSMVVLASGRRPRKAHNYNPGGGGPSSRWAGIEALGGSVLIAGEPGDADTELFFGNAQDTYDIDKNGMRVTLAAEGPSGTSPNSFKHENSSYLHVTGQNGLAVPYVLTADLMLDPSMSQIGLHANAKYNDYTNVNWKGMQVGFDWEDGPNKGGISYETWITGAPSNATSTHLSTHCQRTYTLFSTGQTGNQPFLPRGLQSKVVGTTTDQHILLIPYSTRFRVIHEIILNVDETWFADWNTMLTALGAGGPLAAGMYHRMTTWIQVGSITHCTYWRVPLDRTQGGTTPRERQYLNYWGVEFDTSTNHGAASGTVRFTGTPGSSLPAGQKIYTQDGLRRYSTPANNITDGTAQAGSTSTTLKLQSNDNAADDFYRRATITITAGTGSGQERIVLGNVASTKTVTVESAWTTTPDATSRYKIKGPWVLAGDGLVDILCSSSLAAGSPKTSGYYANLPDAEVFTFSPGSVPSGFDSDPTGQTAMAGGIDVSESPGAMFWYWELAILKNYNLPATPTDDALIFETVP